MKKTIFISGIITANIMTAGCLFKVMHWPGASVLLILASALFCLFFLPAALYSNFNEQGEKQNAALYIVTGIVFFIGVTGILFKVMHWPGASALLLVGIPLPFILFLPVYIITTNKKKNYSHKNFAAVMFALMFIATFNVFLAMRPSQKYLEELKANGQEYVNTNQ